MTDQYLPQHWIDAWATWAPYLLAALVVTTALVHLLLPVARIVERWSRASAVTWDDAPARRLVEILTWLASLTALLISLIPRLAMGGMREPQPQPRRKRATMRPPVDGPLALALCVLAAACVVAASGCGGTVYGQQARAAHLTAIATDATGQAIDAARDYALDAVEDAHPEHGEARTAALDTEAERWRPAGQTLDAIREALLTWVTSIEAARALGEDGASVLWPRVLAIAARVAALYGRVAALARELGATGVPALPTALSGLLASP